MATKQTPAIGSEAEVQTFSEVMQHYEMSRADLDQRRKEWDKTDVLFRSHIEESGWPYRSTIFDPRIFTSIFEKTSRLFANKPKGRLVPREGGDSLGAMINNQLLDFQWDDNERVDGMPMLAKWAQMDQNTRKYGAAFALCKWRYQRSTRRMSDDEKNPKGESLVFYDGPDFKPLANRDVLTNPSYSTIKNWIIVRDYVTVEELRNVNDAARGKPIYKNLDLLLQRIESEESTGGDTRASNYTIKDKSLKGLEDYLGRDETSKYKTVEIATEYRKDRWITFAPRHGVVLRDIPNPYDHGQIPVVMLRYYPIDDDIYGLAETEPVAKLQRAVNALWSQYVDQINMSLYSPLKVRNGAVEMHTLEFGPGKKWLMNDPSSDVVSHDQSPTGVSEFATTYRLLVNAMLEGLGEASAGVSSAIPGSDKKTATEINSSDLQRLARDNYNQIFLAEALKKQMMLWQRMNSQFLFTDPSEQVKVIRIVGKEAIRYFEEIGLDSKVVPDEAIELLASPEMEGLDLNPMDFAVDRFPVETREGGLPKFILEDGGDLGHLIIEPNDLSGTYDYIADVESMGIPNKQEEILLMKQLLEAVQNPALSQGLAQDGYKIKSKELIEDIMEKSGIKDADKYFERMEVLDEQTIAGGAEGLGAGELDSGAIQPSGVDGGIPANVGVEGTEQLG